MKIFIDTANVEDIRKAQSWGILDGVTTNPTLIAREGRKYEEALKEISTIVNGPISAEVISLETKGMVEEGKRLAKIHKNINIKIPMTPEGMVAVRELAKENIPCNVTLVFSANQALLAAKAGAAFVSPFIGRLDDAGHIGMDLVREIIAIYQNYGFQTEIITASIRNPIHVIDAAMAGSHIATIPFKIIDQMFRHPLTDIGIKKFLEDWEKIPK